MTGIEVALIGLLVGAVIYLMLAPGALQTIKARMSEIVDGIFKPTF